MEEFKSQYKHLLDIPVAWGEMDALGHVNNAVYFRYFESVRLDYFESHKFMQTLTEHGKFPVLADVQCRFRRAVTFPDTLTLGARITDLNAHGFTMEYGVYSQAQQTLASVGTSKVVIVDKDTGRKGLIPESLAKLIAQDVKQG
ncbi:thioesterase family protein [Paraferrimonas sp. SM1919]|uniref:acyl-CoA thioesterase n=1 Tax=Paraferrimonas sp. SM1919 TaxID=2662263 RepID=UPI0013D60342|nr:acyl-CoA thioesterase [Paraferrimonas sp. SM1919]